MQAQHKWWVEIHLYAIFYLFPLCMWKKMLWNCYLRIYTACVQFQPHIVSRWFFKRWRTFIMPFFFGNETVLFHTNTHVHMHIYTQCFWFPPMRSNGFIKLLRDCVCVYAFVNLNAQWDVITTYQKIDEMEAWNSKWMNEWMMFNIFNISHTKIDVNVCRKATHNDT